jgi:hypothetical protein
MAKTSSASIGVTVTGDGVSNSFVPPGSPMQNTAAPSGGTTPLVLAAGNNVVTLPAGAKGVVISPPITSTNAKTIKGVAGDTGIGILAGSPIMLTFVAGTTVFSINSTGIETVNLHWL